MTLPMVTCPLCCRPGFSTTDSLCSALINVSNRKLCCPICNFIVIGLDKFTIHLFTHSLNKYGIEHVKDSFQMCKSNNENLTSVQVFPSHNNAVELESVNNLNLNNSSVKLQNNQETSFKAPEKGEWKVNSNSTQHESQKSLNIPDTSVICFHADSGQLFAISSDGLGAKLKNVTINTQSYITNTNITTSTVQANVVEKVQKRKYSQVFEEDSIETFSRIFDQENTNNYLNVESVNSWPSVSSVSSETDKQTCNNISGFESCKDLLTKGDFSTFIDDICDTEVKKEGNYSDNLSNEVIIDDSSYKQDKSKKKDGLSCELCPYAFPNKTILAMHKQLIHKKVELDIENKRKLLLCNLCPRTFSLRSSLMIHQKVAHAGGFGNNENGVNPKQPPAKPACHICGKFFKKEIHLTQHMKAHDEKQWQCTICSKTFTTKYFLKKHRRLHTGETPYKCSTCSKSFTFQQSYHKHLLYHNDEKPYCCAQCGRLFKELSTLHNHERIHSGEKPFSCETCGKAFRQRVSYLVHRRIHTGAMPYQCTACNKSFRYKISQRTHKCTLNPPGVVVRTNGSLVERLQAAMNKAAVECDKKITPIEMSTDKLSSPSKVSSFPESKISEKSPVACIPATLRMQSNEMASSNLNDYPTKLLHTETSDVEKTIIDKPQIYLLVKGPNEETYYQPLLLSQNSNIIVKQNCSALPLQKTKINVKSIPRGKGFGIDKPSTDLEVIADQIFMNSTDCNLSFQSGEVSPAVCSFIKEKEKDCSEIMNEKTGNSLSKKNTFHMFINDKKCKSQPSNEINEGSANSLSDDSTMNDIITSLTCEFSEMPSNPETNVHKVISSKPDSSSDIILMDSSDIFSFIFNPPLSSSSECLGRLSLSPSNNSQHIAINDNFDSSEVYRGNFNGSNDEQHFSLFDNISDDALKELLFGSSK